MSVCRRLRTINFGFSLVATINFGVSTRKEKMGEIQKPKAEVSTALQTPFDLSTCAAVQMNSWKRSFVQAEQIYYFSAE